MHQDEGHYAGKHPAGTGINEAAAEAVKKRVKNERISCRSAHEAAIEAGVSLLEIGKTLDILEIRINGCQLGLFGHGGKDHGKAEMKLPDKLDNLKKSVKGKCDDQGISCYDLWIAAGECGSSKMTAAAVCDELEINIHSCQLGVF